MRELKEELHRGVHLSAILVRILLFADVVVYAQRIGTIYIRDGQQN